MNHLQGGHCRFRTLVTGFAGTIHRLLHRIHGENSETYRYPRFQRDLLQSITNRTADIFEVRCLATNDTAERNNSVVLFGERGALCSQRNFFRSMPRFFALLRAVTATISIGRPQRNVSAEKDKT